MQSIEPGISGFTDVQFVHLRSGANAAGNDDIKPIFEKKKNAGIAPAFCCFR
jgi:hypothetical protein